MKYVFKLIFWWVHVFNASMKIKPEDIQLKCTFQCKHCFSLLYRKIRSIQVIHHLVIWILKIFKLKFSQHSSQLISFHALYEMALNFRQTFVHISYSISVHRSSVFQYYIFNQAGHYAACLQRGVHLTCYMYVFKFHLIQQRVLSLLLNKPHRKEINASKCYASLQKTEKTFFKTFAYFVKKI